MRLKKNLFTLIILGLPGLILVSSRASGAEELPGRTTFPHLASETVNYLLPEKTAPAPELSRLFPGNGKKLNVLIDPGHGGKDWGTVGVCNLLEKNPPTAPRFSS
ncbi:MAG: hypothetical protein NT056_01555 [Proteobacteria bacterium]|nr:hypothetical protein [Pseudomonadota bacterium]